MANITSNIINNIYDTVTVIKNKLYFKRKSIIYLTSLHLNTSSWNNKRNFTKYKLYNLFN